MYFVKFTAVIFLITCHERIAPVLASKCYLETSSKKIIDGDICRITFDKEGCMDQTKIHFNYMNEELVEINEYSANPFGSFFNISFKPSSSGSFWLVINGVISLRKEKRCIDLCFYHIVVRPNDPVTLHVESLKLPNGLYNLTGFVNPRTGFSKKLKPKCSEIPLSFQVVTHQGFRVEWKEPEKDKHLEKKRDLMEKECSCSSNCIESYHEYFDDSGLLRFYYNITDNYCSNFSIKLLKLINQSINTENECLNLESSNYYTLKMMAPVGPTRYATKVPIDFPNTPTGCYLIRTLKGVFHGFFWLEAKNITQMDTWNTTILLTSRNFESSLEVAWISPDFPYNFTSWSLTLWYVKDSKVRCEGIESESNVIQAIDPDYPVLKTSSYTFSNLSEGFYCVRLSPIDERCPADGCIPRSSRTVRLTGPAPTVSMKSSLSLWVVCVLIVVGIVIGVSFAFFCYTFYRSSFKPVISYASVSLLEQYQLDPVCVLVIWTKSHSDVNNEFENVVTAFKNLLRTYSNCKIIDYLDYTSLDWRERQYLRTNPTEWLHSHLQDSKEKIIFVGSQGMKSKCHNSDRGSSNGVIKDESNWGHGDTLDDLLFPFVLRYLKESRELSSNYGRIFYIRFPSLYSQENEFEDIVPWMRFSIPNHLRNLTLKLRGYAEETSSLYPNPPEKQIKNLQMLLDNCHLKRTEIQYQNQA